MTSNEQRPFAERLQEVYQHAQRFDDLTQSEKDAVTKRIQEPFLHTLSNDAQRGFR